MAKMSVLANRGEWDSVQRISTSWLESFSAELLESSQLSDEEKASLLKSVIQQVDSIIENAQKDMVILQTDRLKELRNLDSVNQYLEN